MIVDAAAILVGILLVYAIVTVSSIVYAMRDLQRRGQPQKAVQCAVAFTAFWPLGMTVWLFWRKRYPLLGSN